MPDITKRQVAVALAHPGDRRSDIERRPIPHRGLEADQRPRLVVAFHRLLPAVTNAAVIIGQDRAAAPRQIAREAAIDLARGGGRRIDQNGMALGAAGQEQRRSQRISIRSRHHDVVGENVVQRSFRHRDFPRASR